MGQTIVAIVAWWIPHALADVPGSTPGDDALSCEQIATELAPYARAMTPNVQALGGTQMQLYGEARQKMTERKAENAALGPLATAGALDPTGAAKRAYELAVMAQMAKERAEDEAYENSPLAQQGKAQMADVAAQAKQMQSNSRVLQLMQLAQQKRCDKR